jgi:hypothetical protein
MGVNVTGMAPFPAVPHKNFAIFGVDAGSIAGRTILQGADLAARFCSLATLEPPVCGTGDLGRDSSPFFSGKKVEAMNVGASRNCFAEDGPIATPDS